MSSYKRYKHYWYPHIVTLLKLYPDELEDTPKGNEAKMAIQQALNRTLHERDGEDKIKAIKMIYFDKIYTIDGTAQKLYVSRRTLDYWKSDFINKVAEEMNYL